MFFFFHENRPKKDIKVYLPDQPFNSCDFSVFWVVSTPDASEPLIDAHAHLPVVGRSFHINDEAFRVFLKSHLKVGSCPHSLFGKIT